MNRLMWGTLPLLVAWCGCDASGPDDRATEPLPLCFVMESHFEDAGAGEDHWTEVDALRPLRGWSAQISDDDGVVWSGFLGGGDDEESGCVSGISSGTYDVQITTQVFARGHDLSAAPVAGACNGMAVDADAVSIQLDDVELGPNVSFEVARTNDCIGRTANVLLAATEALVRHELPAVGPLLIKTDDVGSFATTGRLRIGVPNDRNPSDGSVTGHWARKNLIAHELGHAVAINEYGRAFNGTDCDWWTDSSVPPESVCIHPNKDPADLGDGHWFNTLEFSSCAANEGFAHFFAAGAFNDWSTTEGVYRYYNYIDGEGTLRDIGIVDEPNGVYARPISASCDYTAPGLGTPGDWARAFWWLRSTGDTTTSDMLTWISEANWGENDVSSWSQDAMAVCDDLDSAVVAEADAFQTGWSEAKARNGVCPDE